MRCAVGYVRACAVGYVSACAVGYVSACAVVHVPRTYAVRAHDASILTVIELKLALVDEALPSVKRSWRLPFL